MAANWWKYGLCVFGGLGVGFAVGVRTAKNKAEKEKEEEIASIREIYRNDRKAQSPKKKPEQKQQDKHDVMAKTSIKTEMLSEKRKNAEEAMGRYSGKFKGSEPVEAKDEEDDDILEDKPSGQSNNVKDYIHVSTEEPEDCDYPEEVLNYYVDGVVTRYPSDKQLDDSEIENYLGGNDTLKLLDDDNCNQVYVVNDLYNLKYIIIFNYNEWAQKTDEEPYKKTL